MTEKNISNDINKKYLKIEENIKLKVNNIFVKERKLQKHMDKKLKTEIELIFKDLLLNGDLCNEDLLNLETRNEIKELICDIFRNIISKKSDFEIFKDYEEYIDLLLTKSVKVIGPTYNSEDIIKLNNQIKELKKIPQPEQRTPEWYAFRNGRLTASDLGTIIGVNPYEKYEKVLKKKCGIEVPFFMNNNIRRGVKYEDPIIQIYEHRNKVKVFEYGCIPHPEIGHFGASPDGIVDSGSLNQNFIGRMVEIKCPKSRPITGFCPGYYHAQVQGQLEVCDLDYCDFVECQITEYQNQEEYLADCLEEGNYILNKEGFEKGVIINSYDKKKGKDKFYYCELGFNRDQIEEWKDKIIDEILENEDMEYLGETYWRAYEYNELLIKRDRKFWNETCLPKINKFWEDVLHYRKRPFEEIESLGKSKKQKKSNEPEDDNINKAEDMKNFITCKEDKKESMFLSDSDDDDNKEHIENTKMSNKNIKNFVNTNDTNTNKDSMFLSDTDDD